MTTVNSEIIFLNGKPGSGKTTLASVFAKLDSSPDRTIHLPVGERLRAIAGGNLVSEFFLQLIDQSRVLAEDKSVPSETTLNVVHEFVAAHKGYLIIVDGLRLPEGTTELKSRMKKLQAHVLATCVIQVSDEVARERMLGRPQRDDRVQEDDTFINQRLAEYRRNVVPTINYLQQDFPYYEIDGTLAAAANAHQLLTIYQSERIS